MFFTIFSRTLRWINLLLFIMVAFSLFYLIRVVLSTSLSVPSETKPLMAEKRTGSESTSRGLSIDDYASLLRENPFGIKGEFRLLRVSEGSQMEAQAITLVGTVSGGDYNYAIVVDSSGRQEIFRKGQQIYGLGRLRAVYKDKIVIRGPSGDRVYEIADLIIKEVKGQGSEMKRGPEASPQTSQGMPFSVQRGSRNIFTINSEALRQAIENPREILTDARFVPNIVDGRQEGFIVKELKKGGIYESLGLEDGDILLRVNDFPITGPESALQAFTALKGMDRIELDIMRRGQRISMTYQIR